MKVLDPGHVYELNQLDIHPNAGVRVSNRLIFVKREGDKYPGNIGSHEGTTIQEVLRALIDRVRYLNKQEHDNRNFEVIDHLREAIWELESRAAERHGRFDRFIVQEDLASVEAGVTCFKCLHVGCRGECH